MDYPIQSPGQLTAHLRALRKSGGMSQAQLGAVLGVGQTRITRIERDPNAVSVEQFLALLGAMGVQMVLRPSGPRIAAQASKDLAEGTSPRGTTVKRRPPDEPW